MNTITNNFSKGGIGLNIVVFNILLLSLLILNSAYSQDSKIRLTHYSINQGLSQSSVICMTQDSLGFIWLGTQDGLDRFDGYNFSIFRPVPGDTGSISDNSIFCMHVDKSGVIWVGTENGGLNRFNDSTCTFKSFEYNPNKAGSISSNCIMSISENATGNLWIGTYKGLNFFEKSKSKFIQFHHQNNSQSISSDTIYSTYIDSKGNLWVGTQSGLDLYNTKTKLFSHFYHSLDKGSLVSNRIFSLAGDKSGNIWIGTPKGLDKLNISSGKLVHYKYLSGDSNSINSNFINTLYVDNKGIIWIGTDTGGLNFYNPQAGLFTRFNNKMTDAEDAIDKQIVSVLKDKEGLIWIGTFSSGVYTCDYRQGLFDIIKATYKGANKLAENDISSICTDRQQNLWFGTNNSGLNKFDKKSKKFIHYVHSSSSLSLSNNSVNTLFKDRLGNIWIGTISGLDKYLPSSNTFFHFKHNAKNINSLGNKNVISIKEDNLNNLWLGLSGGGIDKFDPVHNKFTHYRHDPANPNSVCSNDILYLFFDNKGILWIGTDGNGLDRLDPKTGKFIHYVHNPSDKNSLSHNVVFAVYQFPDDTCGNIWIGTGGGGLDLLNKETGKIKFYTELNGLANNDIYGILGDKKRNLWMSTNHGISEYEIHNKIFRNYDINDNLQSNEFNQGVFFEDSNGKMYFGGIDGLNTFFPESIKNNRFTPRIVFTSFKDLNNPANTIKSIWTTNGINLSYKDNIVSFKFASLSYIDPTKNQFAYMLSGINENWIDNGTSNMVTFSNLSPGKYILYVKGTNNDGIWSNKNASINILIESPYWQTWWFRSLIILCIAASIFFIFKFRIKAVKKQNKKLESLVNDRTKQIIAQKEKLESVNKKQAELVELLTNSEKELKELNWNKDKIMSVLAHDLRSPFNGLLGFTEILANDIEQLRSEEIKDAAFNIHNSAGQLLKLLNNLLEWSLVQSGMIKYTPSIENLFESAEAMMHLFYINAEQKSIRLKNDIKEDILVWADKDMVDIVFRNLISNAIKFTERNGTVEITSRDKDEFVEIKVSDSGIGMNEEKRNRLFNLNSQVTSKGTNNESGTGLGLNLCKELINKHGGNIRIESKTGQGTSVIFTLRKPLLN